MGDEAEDNRVAPVIERSSDRTLMASHCKDQAQESSQCRHFEEQAGSTGGDLKHADDREQDELETEANDNTPGVI